MTAPPGSSADHTAQPTEAASVRLAGQHAFLLSEVTARAQDVLGAADQGTWPAAQLHRFLDYLHLEVLRQLTDEEWLVFRAYHRDPQDLAPLHQDHVQLRAAIEALTAASEDAQSPQELATAVRDLITALAHHHAGGERILGSDTPSTTALGSTPHTWYALTEGRIIDLDTLPGAHGLDAALGRLLRLRGGEEVELRASTDPFPIWRRLATADPGGYGFSYLHKGPPQWRAQISRRTGR
jgi:uncharacterized protein (DUF2249 family)